MDDDGIELDQGGSDELSGTGGAEGALLELALRYLDGLTTDDESARLCEQLATRPAFREAFVRLCAERAMLAEIAWTTMQPAAVGDWPVPKSCIGPSSAPGLPAVESPMAGLPDLVDRDAHVPLSWFARLWGGEHPSLPLLSLAFVAAVAAATIGLRWAERTWQAESTTAVDAVEQPRDLAFATDYVATLTRTANCRWEISGSPTEIGSRLAPSEIHLASGLAEIVFDQGTRVILEGPADFTPQSSRAGFLRSGKLVARVPSRANAFTIQTPSAIVNAQGGEYAMLADAAGATEVHVLAGETELGTRGDSLSVVAPIVVAAPLAVRVGTQAGDAPRSIPPRPMEFARSVQPVRLDFPSSLISYWNFDEQGGPAGDLAGRNDGSLQGVSRTQGLVGRGAVEFNDRHGQVVNVGGGDGSFACTEGITVEALIVSRWDGVSNLDASGWNYDEIFRKDDGDRRILLALQNDVNCNEFAEPSPALTSLQGHVLSFGINVGGKYRELDMPLDGREGRPTLAELTDGKPHHVVATYNSMTGEKAIFVDGRRRHAFNYKPDSPLATGGLQPAAIGNGANMPWEAFSGVIDEVAIYRQALNEEEIARHWSRARNGQAYFETTPSPSQTPADHPRKVKKPSADAI